MELLCPSCGRDCLHEKRLDRYSDVLFRQLVCLDCGCEFVAKYCLTEIVNGSVRSGESVLSFYRQQNVGAQMVRHMIASYEENRRNC